jgi:hypothetical protein
MNPVIESLKENLRQIKLVAEPTEAGFTNDRGNTGDKKEVTIQQFIASYLTSDYKVKKGCIYNKTGASKNIDCVVLFPNHPELITPMRDVIIAEGVYAAIEVKPDIATLTATSEFHRAVLQIQSVKQLARKRVQIDMSMFGGSSLPSPYFDKIPGVIFSFKSQDIKNVIAYLQHMVTTGLVSDEELPDIIVSIDKGILFYCPKIKETIFQPYLENMCTSYPDRVFVEIEEKDEALLTWFFRLFFSLPKPSVVIADPILHEYLEFDGNVKLKFIALDPSEPFIMKTPPAVTP